MVHLKRDVEQTNRPGMYYPIIAHNNEPNTSRIQADDVIFYHQYITMFLLFSL